MLRTAAIVLCSVLLCLSLFGANVVFAVDRGPMDPDHMTDSMDRAGVYEYAHAEIVHMATEEAGEAEIEGFDIALDSIIAEALGPELIQQEVERNVEDVYAYLSGDADELVIRIETGTIEDEARVALAEEIDEIDYAELGFEEFATIVESEDAYEHERAALRAEIMQEFGITPENGFGNPTLADLIADPDSYVETRDELYEETNGDREVLEAHIDFELPDEAPEAVHDEAEALEALVVDAVATEMSYETFSEEYASIADDIESATATYIWEHRDEYSNELDEVLEERTDVPAELEEEIAAFETLALEAVLTDLSYDEFIDRVDAAESELIDAVLTFVFADEGAIPSEFELSEELERDAGDELELIRSIFSMIGLAGIALSAISLGLIGGVYAVSRDPATTGIAAGTVSSLVGGISYAGASLVPSWLADLLGGVDAGEEIAMLQELVALLLTPWATQSLVLLGAGLLITVGGVAVHLGFIDVSSLSGGSEVPTESEGAAETDATATDVPGIEEGEAPHHEEAEDVD